eukprot:CAMPEP_0183711764 /NCGR_PEP_ID=MMETSP0737-20130205/7172_1 /TAXON_ID=385413 /ORGANISM="Thalassiosira miniscula, Strain CCMP1093" /LENGTH=435 /DNA_ID=CAMNT_0025940331 /DNA_START=195 /DNA_END=1505 /DNA_ORIENTATION=+
MQYNRITVALMLLHLDKVNAFQPASNNNIVQHSPQRSSIISTKLHTASLDSIPSLESILDDGHGHINANLAQAIYEWETAHNDGHANILKNQFSSRDGLRLVDELAREILSSLIDTNDDNDDDNEDGAARKSGISYSDLVQEGMIALLRALSTYDNYKSHKSSNSNNVQKKLSNFEEYAKDAIHSSFLHYLATSSRPIRLPLQLQVTLQKANAAADKLRTKLNKEPSLVQVAKEVNVKPEQLALYRKLYRGLVSRAEAFVSVEDGMEVYDPTLAGVGMGTGVHARKDFDVVGGSTSMTAGGGSGKSALGNSQEDNWERDPPERSVTPLRDVLTDKEEINNPLSYTHHELLNEELEHFLEEMLSPEELTIIQLRFGLVDSKYGGKGWTAKDIGKRMGMTREEVVRVASGALEKLRRGSNSLLYDVDFEDAFVEVSL